MGKGGWGTRVGMGEPVWGWETRAEIRNQGQERVPGCTVRARLEVYKRMFQAFPISGTGQGCMSVVDEATLQCQLLPQEVRDLQLKATCWVLHKTEEFLTVST